MIKKILFCLVAILFMPPVFADVYKWKDANGGTHYGDALPIADAAIVRTDQQTDEQIANGEKAHPETENSTRQDAMNEAGDPAKSSGINVHNVRVIVGGSAARPGQIHTSIDKEKLVQIVPSASGTKLNKSE